MSLAIGGFVIGVAFGWLAQATNYCLMGAVTDWRLGGDKGRLGAAALAAATAIVGAQALDGAGVVELSRSMYLTPRINWAGAIGGGLLFGAGMVFAGGCPSRALVRTGGGDVRALLALIVMAIAAYATLSGIFGMARVSLDQATAFDLAPHGIARQSLPELFGFSGSAGLARWGTAGVIAALLAIFAARAMAGGSWLRNLIAGLGAGGIVTLGWALTGLASDEMAVQPVEPASLSFVRPVADAIDWIERATAIGLPGLGAASVFGMLIGSFAASAVSGSLRLQGFQDTGDLARHLFGAVAMGVGGIIAMGCTIGQGITGVSTLSAQSFLAVSAIVAGAVWGLRRLQATV